MSSETEQAAADTERVPLLAPAVSDIRVRVLDQRTGGVMVETVMPVHADRDLEVEVRYPDGRTITYVREID